MRLLKGLAAAVVTTVGLGGCEVTVGFDPTGGTGVIFGDWTIDGGEANSTSCAAAGIATVQVEVFRQSGIVSYTDSTLSAPCSAGSFRSPPTLLSDTYRFQWVGLDSSGFEVARSSGFITETIEIGEEQDLGRVDFATDDPPPTGFNPLGSDFTTDATWTINGGAADATSCAGAGIDIVALRVLSEDLSESVDIEFDCEIGGFDSRNGGDPVFRQGMFFTQWVGKNAAGTIVAGPVPPEPIALNTITNTHATLVTVDFETAQPLGLEVTLAFETTDGAMDYMNCAGAGVESFGFELTDSGGNVVDMMFGITPCNEVLTWDDTVVTAGESYTLDVTGDGAGGKKWGIQCSGLDVASGLEQYNCTVDVM